MSSKVARAMSLPSDIIAQQRGNTECSQSQAAKNKKRARKFKFYLKFLKNPNQLSTKPLFTLNRRARRLDARRHTVLSVPRPESERKGDYPGFLIAYLPLVSSCCEIV